MTPRPMLADITQILTLVGQIDRPYGDNEGDALNGDTIYPYLTAPQQQVVDEAERLCRVYTRDDDGSVNLRSINSLKRKGFTISLGPSQYAQDTVTGGIDFGDYTLDLSDHQGHAFDD